MLKNIRISELQFHLRDENCKVYPATIIELPFYLSLKHDDRKIYDTYHDYIINGCSSDFAGLHQDYEYFINLYNNIKKGWDTNLGRSKQELGLVVNKTVGQYRMTDGMHRCAILYYIYGDINLIKINDLGRKRACYQPILNKDTE